VSSSERTGEHVTLADAAAFVARWRWTVATVVALTVAATALSTLRQPPRFVATTTLLMQNEERDRGPLSELTLLAGPPGAEGEIALLRSRSLMEEVVADPASGAGEAAPQALQRARLGLATDVQAEDLTTLRATWRALRGTERRPHRLRAAFEELPADALPTLRVAFDDDGGVRVTSEAGETLHEGPFTQGLAVSLSGGGRLVLQAEGEYAGQAYAVRRRRPEAAVAALRPAVRARETARGSGVIELSVEARDPALAADVANALAQNYIVKSIELGSRQATRTAEFVGKELDRVREQLELAEEDFVRVAREHARAIDLGASAAACVDRLAELEADRTRLRLARATCEGVRADLAEGRFESLAALDPELLSGLSGGFVASIGELQGLLPQLERSDVSGYKGLLQGRVEALRVEREELERRAAVLRADLAALAAGEERALERIGVTTLGGDRYAEELAAIESQLALLVPSVTEKHYERATREAALATLETRLRERAESLLAGLEADGRLVAQDLTRAQERLADWPRLERERIDVALRALVEDAGRIFDAQLAGLVQRLADLQGEIATLEGELATLPESERLLAEPLRRRETLTKVVQLLADSQQRAHLTQAATLPSAVVLDSAQPPRSPTGPHLFVSLFAALVAGSVLGMGVAYLRQAIGEGLYTAAELEHETGLAVLACVPRAKGSQSLVQATAVIDGVSGEPYRSIGDGLRFLASPDDRLQVVGLTSCLPGEGKTYTTTRLALALASLGQRVLLVDGDLRRPRVAERLGLAPSPGLAEVLSGETSWQDCLRTGRSDRVDVITAGRAVRAPATLLSGPRMDSFLAEARERYDLVLLDLPPVLPVTDVEAAGAHLDGVLLVYRTGGTSRRALRRGIERLRRAGAVLRGAVLNGIAERAAYADGFTYGYAYEESDGSERRRAG